MRAKLAIMVIIIFIILFMIPVLASEVSTVAISASDQQAAVSVETLASDDATMALSTAQATGNVISVYSSSKAIGLFVYGTGKVIVQATHVAGALVETSVQQLTNGLYQLVITASGIGVGDAEGIAWTFVYASDTKPYTPAPLLLPKSKGNCFVMGRSFQDNVNVHAYRIMSGFYNYNLASNGNGITKSFDFDMLEWYARKFSVYPNNGYAPAILIRESNMTKNIDGSVNIEYWAWNFDNQPRDARILVVGNNSNGEKKIFYNETIHIGILSGTRNVITVEPDGAKQLSLMLGNIELEDEDHNPPRFNNVTPANGTILNTISVTITAIISDKKSGVNESSIRMIINGAEVEPVVKPVNLHEIELAYNANLSEGKHYIAIGAMDNAGNKAIALWQFTIALMKESTLKTTAEVKPTNITMMNEPKQGLLFGFDNSITAAIAISLGLMLIICKSENIAMGLYGYKVVHERRKDALIDIAMKLYGLQERRTLETNGGKKEDILLNVAMKLYDVQK